MGFFCISASGRGLTYSIHLLILNQRHHNLHSLELPSKISFSLFWSYAKNYSLVTTLRVGMVCSGQQPQGLLQPRILSHPSETSVIIFFYRWREWAIETFSDLGGAGWFSDCQPCTAASSSVPPQGVRHAWAPESKVLDETAFFNLMSQPAV